MTFSSEQPIGIIYHHNAQFNPLLDRLSSFGIPYELINPAEQLYNPAKERAQSGLIFTDLSSPPYLTHNALNITQTIEYVHQLEQKLDYTNVQLVNGFQATEVLASKAKQLRLLASLRLPTPATRVVSTTDHLLAAANELTFPVLVKNDRLKEHGAVRRYESVSDVITALINNTLQLGGGKTLLIQEYIQPDADAVVRVEVLRREVSFARKITYAWSAEEHWPLEATAEIYEVPYEIERQIERIANTIGLDAGAIEYVVDRKKNVWFYGIGPHTSTLSIQTRGLDFDPNIRLAEFLEEQVVAAKDTGIIDFVKN